MYANLTADQKNTIRRQYRAAMEMHANVGQAASIAASQGLRMTDRQWNGKAGANAFAAALATLVMSGDITIADAAKPAPLFFEKAVVTPKATWIATGDGGGHWDVTRPAKAVARQGDR